MLNGSVLSKHFWSEAIRIACYTQNRSIIDKTPYEIFRKRISYISYFHVFGFPTFIHNHKDHLGKFNAKVNDEYFLGYSFVSKAFRVLNARRQQVKETFHVTFDESIEAIRFFNTSVNEIGINDSSRYPLDEFLKENDPSRQYLVDSDISYYIIPHNRSITKSLMLNMPLKWSRKQHIELVNIIGEPTNGMLTRIITAKLTAALVIECLFADFLLEIKPKKVKQSLALKRYSGTRKMNTKLLSETKQDSFLRGIDYRQEEGMHYDETFAHVASMDAIRIFLDYATYMNFLVVPMDVKSALLNGKHKEEVYV
ncbi:retrovirus-related pol polyprotein from transposon TNT 1-94 [Tanacetum coccineum]